MGSKVGQQLVEGAQGATDGGGGNLRGKGR
jgi:hypothetical protein